MSVWAQSLRGNSEVDLENGSDDNLRGIGAQDSLAGIKVKQEIECQNCRE